MMIYGRLNPFFETGTEGVCWSVCDRILPGYDGLFVLRPGDQLAIFDDAGAQLWHGVIDLEYERDRQSYPTNPGHGQQAVFGYWVHGFQREVEPETWGKWFFDERRASLVPMLLSLEPHPFHAAAAALPDLLRQLPDKLKAEYANGARYQWISWYGQRIDDGQPGWQVSETTGVHADLGFTEDEALRIIGSPAPDIVRAWQLMQKPPIDEAMLLRLVLLIGVTGRLILIFGQDKVKMAAWVTPLRESFFTLNGLIELHDHMRNIVEHQSLWLDNG